ncbi:MAG TPA: zinc ribbon domain-containing protein [Kofleriaceae bacterium]|nr:zinc ribbon domain-containing protein [Kofleriaceae bacterium]
MPVYEYRCTSCHREFEYQQRMSDPEKTTCEACGQEALERLISRTAFQLKGSGWYKDLYSSSKPESKTSTDSASSSSGTSSTTTPSSDSSSSSSTPSSSSGSSGSSGSGTSGGSTGSSSSGGGTSTKAAASHP